MRVFRYAWRRPLTCAWRECRGCTERTCVESTLASTTPLRGCRKLADATHDSLQLSFAIVYIRILSCLRFPSHNCNGNYPIVDGLRTNLHRTESPQEGRKMCGGRRRRRHVEDGARNHYTQLQVDFDLHSYSVHRRPRLLEKYLCLVHMSRLLIPFVQISQHTTLNPLTHKT